MSNFTKEIVYLILQFLNEENYKQTLHALEKEFGYFINMGYVEECVIKGEWDEVEKYLSGFMRLGDNKYTKKIFFEIRKQKYLEALDSGDHAKAVEILQKDLKIFDTRSSDIFKDLTMLLGLRNIREHKDLKSYGDTKTARAILLSALKWLIKKNPPSSNKLQFPTLDSSRLRSLVNQSIDWQRQLCKNPRHIPDIKSLFEDHTCGQPNDYGAPPPMTNMLVGSIPNVGGPLPMNFQGFLRAPFTPSLASWMCNPTSMPHQIVSAGPIGLRGASNAAPMLKHPRTPLSNPATDIQIADSALVLTKSNEVNHMAADLSFTNYGQSKPHPSTSDDLPMTVIMNLNQGSRVKSMDFHPVQHIFLLVGTDTGDVKIWDILTRDRLVSLNFKVWNPEACSVQLQASLANEHFVSVNRVIWSPDGALFGVAYSKNIVQIYSYHSRIDIRNRLEIDAHCGNVSDIAFSQRPKQLCIITCGEDKAVKVWDAATGNRLYTLEGHGAPVYSVCPHQKEDIQFIFSTAIDGKIKAWLFDDLGSILDYDAPGHSCTTMAYSCDGTRLFSCGTNKEGQSYLVEWQDSDGSVKRTYHGLSKHSMGIVQFHTTKNRFLAAGDEFKVKFWDMNNASLLMATDAEGGLQASPAIRYSKNGTMLAVSTKEYGIKVLANSIALQDFLEVCTNGHSKVASGSVSTAN